MQSETRGQERAPRRIWANAIEEPVQSETHGPEYAPRRIWAQTSARYDEEHQFYSQTS